MPMPRGETDVDQKNTANAAVPPTNARAEVTDLAFEQRTGEQQRDRDEPDRIQHPVRQQVVLEIDQRERDEPAVKTR